MKPFFVLLVTIGLSSFFVYIYEEFVLLHSIRLVQEFGWAIFGASPNVQYEDAIVAFLDSLIIIVKYVATAFVALIGNAVVNGIRGKGFHISIP